MDDAKPTTPAPEWRSWDDLIAQIDRDAPTEADSDFIGGMHAQVRAMAAIGKLASEVGDGAIPTERQQTAMATAIIALTQAVSRQWKGAAAEGMLSEAEATEAYNDTMFVVMQMATNLGFHMVRGGTE